MSMIRSLVKYPSRIRDMQTQFNKFPHLHGAENPTYLKGSNDKAINMLAGALFAIGTFEVMHGFWKMAWGIGKKE
jgi:hypothetical protein